MGRILGMRVLKLHATVVLAPAEVSRPPTVPGPWRQMDRVTVGDRPTARAALPSGEATGLAYAVRQINEGAQLLEHSRRVDS
ncbi:MAG: hypothetical protein WAK93_11015 [Solirubrobacteraceae bacterium]